MSKLVYKTINEIINGKFMTELSADPVTRMKYEAEANKKQKEAHQAGQSAATMKAQEEGEAAEANKKQEDAARVAAQKEAQKQKEKNENFDAQMTPDVPPVGLPPKPPMQTTPNYEGGNMTKTQLCAAHEATSNIMASIEDYDSLPDWVKAKITLASEYLVKCESFLNAKDQEHEDSQKDNHMPQSPQVARPPMPPASSPSASPLGSPMLGVALGKIQSVSPGE